ncbi:MAG: baseplate J/gp47 family protein [Bacteroides sp.]|nr:baseplate J/gp47 family protein [Bacteroides sp.]
MKRVGLSRKKELERIASVKPFGVIENDPRLLVRQILKIAGVIRYYDHRDLPEGYFDELLSSLKEWAECGDRPSADGRQEPARALLQIFTEHLQELTREFNERWYRLPSWYLKERLGVEPLPAHPYTIWGVLSKKGERPLCLSRGTPFLLKSEEGSTWSCRLEEDVYQENVVLQDICSLYFERKERHLPAGYLHYITDVRYKDLLHDSLLREGMFGYSRESRFSCSPGILITHPSLLLHEGRREVTLLFDREDEGLEREFEEIVRKLSVYFPQWEEEKFIYKIPSSAFCIAVTTARGWDEIAGYVLRKEKGSLRLTFMLEESFLPVSPCDPEIHSFTSSYSALRITANPDAWLYPYSWLSCFLLGRIVIRTQVEGIRNVQVYNHLGRVDVTKPFHLFGYETRKGAWFAVGNYEMSRKKVISADLELTWEQLPEDPEGLCSYYHAYGVSIDNGSFRMTARYLNDYNWYPVTGDSSYYLFSSGTRQAPLSKGRLSSVTSFSHIRTERMPPSEISEEEYEYHAGTRSGFLSFTLDAPAIGFGEDVYRSLFSHDILRNYRKRAGLSSLNPPLSPVVEKIVLNYRSEEIIDLRHLHREEDSFLYRVHPLGITPLIADKEDHVISFLESHRSDANLLFSFTGMAGGEILSLFLIFRPSAVREVSGEAPEIVWYWGDGNEWQEITAETILEDTTRDLRVTGRIKFRVPDDPGEFAAPDGRLWLRAGICRNEQLIPELSSAHLHAVPFSVLVEESAAQEGFTAGKLLPEKRVPGLSECVPVTSLCGGHPREREEELQLRISGYITHRERAVTLRDYERMVLEAFPEVNQVKCIPHFNGEHREQGVITLVILDKTAAVPDPTGFSLLTAVKDHIYSRISAGVKDLVVISPLWVEVVVRGGFTFCSSVPRLKAEEKVREIVNRYIAPWLYPGKEPRFGRSLSTERLREILSKEEFITDIRELGFIVVTDRKEGHTLSLYGGEGTHLSPALPHILYFPAREHLLYTEMNAAFRIGEMEVDHTFIIDS